MNHFEHLKFCQSAVVCSCLFMMLIPFSWRRKAFGYLCYVHGLCKAFPGSFFYPNISISKPFGRVYHKPFVDLHDTLIIKPCLHEHGRACLRGVKIVKIIILTFCYSYFASVYQKWLKIELGEYIPIQRLICFDHW